MWNGFNGRKVSRREELHSMQRQKRRKRPDNEEALAQPNAHWHRIQLRIYRRHPYKGQVHTMGRENSRNRREKAVKCEGYMPVGETS